MDQKISRHRDGPAELMVGYAGYAMADCFSGNMKRIEEVRDETGCPVTNIASEHRVRTLRWAVATAVGDRQSKLPSLLPGVRQAFAQRLSLCRHGQLLPEGRHGRVKTT